MADASTWPDPGLVSFSDLVSPVPVAVAFCCGSIVLAVRCVSCTCEPAGTEVPAAAAPPALLPRPDETVLFISLSSPPSTLDPLASELDTIELPREFLGP